MAANKNATDKLHDLLNPYFNTRANPNWESVIGAIGEADQDVADLIEEVRKQFFIQSAYRPYLDTLANNVGVQRPKTVGMDDATLRNYIPVMSYRPKQVKQILDELVNVFFLRESTTAFAESAVGEPLFLKDGWELSYEVDGQHQEDFVFVAEDFTDISNATAEEIAAVINRQAQYSFAIPFNDRSRNLTSVRVFSNTIGSKGSIEILGGRSNIVLQFAEVVDAGSGSTTVWNITKANDIVSFEYTSGSSINLHNVQAGDIAIIDIPNNNGSFEVESVNLDTNTFTFVNLFGMAETFNHATTPGYYVRFLRKQKNIVFNRENKAIVWEVSPGEVVVEIPATPPVVRRGLKGSAHINGIVATMTSRVSNTSLTIDNATDWPISGMFVMEPKEEIQSYIDTITEDYVSTLDVQGRFDVMERRYTYASKSGNTLIGIDPPLPKGSGSTYEASVFEMKDTELPAAGQVVTSVAGGAVTLTTEPASAGWTVVSPGLIGSKALQLTAPFPNVGDYIGHLSVVGTNINSPGGIASYSWSMYIQSNYVEGNGLIQTSVYIPDDYSVDNWITIYLQISTDQTYWAWGGGTQPRIPGVPVKVGIIANTGQNGHISYGFYLNDILVSTRASIGVAPIPSNIFMNFALQDNPGPLFPDTNYITTIDEFKFTNLEPIGGTDLVIGSIARANNVATVVTTTAHGLVDGQTVLISDVTVESFNGPYEISVISSTSFSYNNIGPDISSSGGTVNINVEGLWLKDSGSRLYLTTAQINTGIRGPYMYDTKAPFVVSSNTSDLITTINAGQIFINIQVSTPNSIPNEQGYLIFDYGLETQEGPIKYTYKASEGIIAVDPAYVFQHSHMPGSSVLSIRRKGAPILSGLGKELALYVTDPGVARIILEDLIKKVKSAGIYLRYIVRFPTQYYSDYDVYGKTLDPLD